MILAPRFQVVLGETKHVLDTGELAFMIDAANSTCKVPPSPFAASHFVSFAAPSQA